MPQAAEVLALDLLRSTGGQPVTLEDVQRRFAELAGHRCGCSCWRCEAAAKAGADRVWRCLRAWRRTTREVVPDAPPAAPMAGIDPRRPLPEQARMLRDTGLTMQEIAAELGCATSTVHRHLHNA